MGLQEPDEEKRRAIQSAAREQIQGLLKANDLAGIQVLLEKQQAEYTSVRVKALSDEYRITKQTVESLEEKIQALKAQGGGWGYDGRQKNIEQLEAEKAEAQHKGVSLLVEESQELADSWELRLQYDDKHLAALETEKVALAGIAEIYGQIATTNPLQKAQVNIQMLEAQKEAIEQHLKSLDVEEDQDASAKAAKEELKKKRLEELNHARSTFNAIQDPSMDPEFFQDFPGLGHDEGQSARGFGKGAGGV